MRALNAAPLTRAERAVVKAALFWAVGGDNSEVKLYRAVARVERTKAKGKRRG